MTCWRRENASTNVSFEAFSIHADGPCCISLGVEGNVLTCCQSKLHHQRRKWQRTRQSAERQRQNNALGTGVSGDPGAPLRRAILFIIKRLHFVLLQMSRLYYTLYYIVTLIRPPKRSTQFCLWVLGLLNPWKSCRRPTSINCHPSFPATKKKNHRNHNYIMS